MSSRRKGEEKEEPTEKTALLSDTDSKGEKDSLASGPVINIYDPSNIGYLMQYYAVGLIYGGLPATVYGFFVGYLNVRHHPLQPRAPAHWAQHLLTGRRSLVQVPAYVYATSGVIMTMPWSFKFFFGMINDCFPIGGYR